MAKVNIAGSNKFINIEKIKLPESIMAIFPVKFKKIFEEIPLQVFAEIEEIRLRINRPILLITNSENFSVTADWKVTDHLLEGYRINRDDMEKILQKVSQNSIYAWEEEFRRGYITLKGGHRIGLTGKIILDKGNIKTMRDISGLNIRIGKEIKGAANIVLPYILEKEDIVRHTLIVSPPRCGKTTLLRDIIRQISTGIPELCFPGLNIGLVDERSELAGFYQGEPQYDIGLRTDVLDCCPKAQGMIMLVRSMSPQVIATDEIGSKEDVYAIEEVLNAGISLITTVHARNLSDLQKRPNINIFLKQELFSRIIILGRSKGVGTIERIIDGKTMQDLAINAKGREMIKKNA